MRPIKKMISVVMCLTLLLAMVVPVNAKTITDAYEEPSISPFYTNISTLFMTSGKTWFAADMTANRSMSLSITVKIYANNVLQDTFRTSGTGLYLSLDKDYNFVSGVSYKLEGTFTAGTETVGKTLTYNP